MTIRRTRVFGERQFLKVIRGAAFRINIVKVLIELFFDGRTFTFTIKLTRKLNLATNQITTLSSITGTFF
jgi:hypothetical protein